MFINMFIMSIVVIFAMTAVGQAIYSIGTKSKK